MENEEYKRLDTIEDETTILSADSINAQVDPTTKKADKKIIAFIIPATIMLIVGALACIYVWVTYAGIKDLLRQAQSDGGSEGLGEAIGAIFMLVIFFIFVGIAGILSIISTAISGAMMGYQIKRKQNPTAGIVYLSLSVLLLSLTVIAFLLTYAI